MERMLTWNDVQGLMDEARVIARRLLRQEARAYSLCASELVLSGLRRQKLADQDWNQVTWQSREHFFSAMYRAMDRALKDHGRRRSARKRKIQQRVTLDEIAPEELLRIARYQAHDMDALDDKFPDFIEALVDALAQLEKQHPEWAQIARHRYYAGLTLEQTAQMMGVAERTVRRHWEKARVLLHDEILNNLHTQGYDVRAASRPVAPCAP